MFQFTKIRILLSKSICDFYYTNGCILGFHCFNSSACVSINWENCKDKQHIEGIYYYVIVHDDIGFCYL